MELKQTGQWFWRDGEVSLKDYYNLSSTERKQHIEFLLTLKESQRSTADNVILLITRTKDNNDNVKFLEL